MSRRWSTGFADGRREGGRHQRQGNAKLKKYRAVACGGWSWWCRPTAPRAETIGFQQAIADHELVFEAVDTTPDDPAMMIFTSGDDRAAEGRAARPPGADRPSAGRAVPHEFFPQPGDLAWTPADWAWAGGLLNLLLPSLYFGVPVVFEVRKVRSGGALGLVEKGRPCATPSSRRRRCRMLKSVTGIRTPASGLNTAHVWVPAGEALGRETYEWAKDELGLTVNEFYGQTECDIVLVLLRGARRQPGRGDRQDFARPRGERSSMRRAKKCRPARSARSRCEGPTR